MKKIVALSFICCMAISPDAMSMCRKKKTESNKSSKQILAQSWTLSYLDGEELKNLYPEKVPVLAFDSTVQRVSGNNGCNHFSGVVKLNGSSITFIGPMVSTRMFCPGAGEQKFMNGLEKITGYIVRGENIEFSAGQKGVMRVTKTKK